MQCKIILNKMDVIQHIIENEKQKKNMKNRFSKNISLCNELFLAIQELSPVTELKILIRINMKYYTRNNKYLLDTENKQKLIQCFCPSVAYKFNMISLQYAYAQVKVFVLNVELDDIKINILAITNNVEHLLGFLLYSTGDNIGIHNSDLISKSLNFMKKDNLYVKYKDNNALNYIYEDNNVLSQNFILTAVMMKSYTVIFNKRYKMKIDKHVLFSAWLFQDVFIGHLIYAILKGKYFNIFHLFKIDRFAIIRIHKNSVLKLNFEFSTFDINNILTSLIPILNFHLPIIIRAKWFKDINSKENENHYFNNFQHYEYGKQDKSTYVFHRNQKSYFKESGINTEQYSYEMESELDINYENYLKFINSTLWLPYLCGDCYDDKIGNISYILKCSCLDESLLDLDNVERYIRQIANILTSMKFYMTTFKDLSKYLAYIFLKL